MSKTVCGALRDECRKPGEQSGIVSRTKEFWSAKLGRPVSDAEAIEMVHVARQLLDLLREHLKSRRKLTRAESENRSAIKF